jgi:hypothetical protein
VEQKGIALHVYFADAHALFEDTILLCFHDVSSRRIGVLVAKKNPHWIFAVVRFVQCKKINKKIET